MYAVHCNFKNLDSAKKFAENVSVQYPDLVFELFEEPELNVDSNLFESRPSFETVSITLGDLEKLSSAVSTYSRGKLNEKNN